jgi:NADPH2:quinone reductase
LASVPARKTWRLPDSLPFDLAAAVPVEFGTADDCLFEFGHLHGDETVLVQAGAGGVGLAAIQLAKAAGASIVIATASSDDRLGRLTEYGMDHGINYASEDVAKRVRELTDGRGVDLVVDPIGGAAFDDAVRALDTEGRLLVIGFAAGGIPTVKVNRLLLRNISVIGVGYGEYVNRKPGSQSVFEFGVAQLVKAGLRPPPPIRYPLAEGSAALQSLADGGVLGKVVLEP